MERASAAQPCILEAFVPFAREVSVVAARGRDGAVECFDVSENEHRDHILKISRVPADLPERDRARGAPHRRGRSRTASAMSACWRSRCSSLRDGGAARQRDRAARAQFRPLDLDGASVSQFEQHIRAVAGWPLAKPVRRGRVEMINLIGDEVDDYRSWLAVPGACRAPLRQDGGAPGPQDGPRHAAVRG